MHGVEPRGLAPRFWSRALARVALGVAVVALSVALASLTSCKDHCAPQRATGFNANASSCCGGPTQDSVDNQRYLWNGKACVPLYRHCGCNVCLGEDCDELYSSIAQCGAAHSKCR